ncbi:unnamed protein product [Rhizoctonia solani]|uniref:ATP-dependent RNA helicase n=1 Tax=Rhizoctonia solani TaxID=456999 RepID=A0A8H2WIA0_9AGAM|nr:unnamed protein product [Rhizoctonia solani]
MRNVPKLKELNYAQWKNIITNSIKRAKLWDYVDGSIEEPPDHDPSGLATYYDEAAASVLTPEGTEMKEFSALCARLTYLSQNPKPEAPVDDASRAPVEDYTNWGVPEDIKAFGLTGNKNPLLKERAAVTCRDCLLKDHSAGTPECPQYQWRNELWGTTAQEVAPSHNSGADLSVKHIVPASRISYGVSEPVKVVLSFDELGLKPQLRKKINYPQPSAIQQCAILPIIQGRNVHIQAPPNNGKTTALAISILQVIDAGLPCLQALVFVSTTEAVIRFQKVTNYLGSGLSTYCSSDVTTISSLAEVNTKHIFVGTPENILGLVHRNIIKMHKLRAVALDDMHQLIELGVQDQILEVYRHVPPLAQIIALSTGLTSPVPSTVSKILADPLQISVNRNEGMTTRAQFYVMIPADQKPTALSALFLALGANGFMLLCHDFIKASNVMKLICFFDIDTVFNSGPRPSVNLTLVVVQEESMKSSESTGVIQKFEIKLSTIPTCITSSGYYSKYDPVSNIILATTDAVLSTIELHRLGVPLVNYDVPSNAEAYFKRLDRWRLADPGHSQPVITFVTADTDEIDVIKGLERDYGVHVAELLWDGESKRIH